MRYLPQTKILEPLLFVRAHEGEFLHPDIEFWTQLIEDGDHTKTFGRFGRILPN